MSERTASERLSVNLADLLDQIPGHHKLVHAHASAGNCSDYVQSDLPLEAVQVYLPPRYDEWWRVGLSRYQTAKEAVHEAN